MLTDEDALSVVAREGILPEVIPAIALRPVVEWALGYYRNTAVAPTPAVMLEEFGDILSDYEIDPAEDVEETIEWALDDLKADYIRKLSGDMGRALVTNVASCPKANRFEVFQEEIAKMTEQATSLQPRTTQVDLRESGQEILADYHFAANQTDAVQGLSFGLSQVDLYTGGIREGELALMAGAPGTGKSWMMNFVAHHNWFNETPTALFTLENSIQMTQMRIACIALHLDYEALQRGTLDAEDLEQLETWVHEVLEKSSTPLHIFSPDGAMRTPQAIVSTARAHGSEVLIIDQLTYMEAATHHRERRDQVAKILRDLRLMISTGRQRMPCLLAHQINREGVKASDKSGVVLDYHLAESAETERTVDLGMALYRSEDMKAVSQMQLQTFKFRRAAPKHFDLLWAIETGNILVRNEIEL